MSDTDLHFSVTLDDAVSAPADRASAAVQRAGQAMARAHEQALKMNAALETQAAKSAAAIVAAEARKAAAVVAAEARASAAGTRKAAAEDRAIQAMGRMHAEALKMNSALETVAVGAEHASHGHEELAGGLLRVIEPAEIARHAVEALGAGLHEMGSALAEGELKGVITGAAEALAGLASTLDLVVPGLGQAAAAAIKAGGAFASMAVGVVQAALEMGAEVAEVNERLEATFQALGHGPEAGRETLSMLDAMARRLPQSSAQLAEWTRQFQAMGVTELGDLRGQVHAVASAQAIGGAEGATAYEAVTRKVRGAIDAHEGLLKVDRRLVGTLHELGAGDMLVNGRKLVQGMEVDARAFGDALEMSLNEKGKGPLEAMGDEWGTLKTKALEAIGHLFDGIDWSPLTDAVKDVIAIGDEGDPAGRALATGVKGGISEIIKGLGELVTDGEIAFLQLELWTIEYGPTARGVIRGIEGAIRGLVSTAELILTPFSDVLGIATQISDALGVGGAARRAGNAAATSPAHAEGGLVGRPAPGEFWASVAPGELIVPAQAAREMSRDALGPGSRGGMPGAQAASSGGGGMRVDRIEVHLHAPSGVTGAQELTVFALSSALERLQLVSGR